VTDVTGLDRPARRDRSPAHRSVPSDNLVVVAPPTPSMRATAALVVALAAVDLGLLGGFGTSSMVTAWWSSVGLAVAVVAISPVRRWPALVAVVAVGAAGVRLAVGIDPSTALAVAGVHAGAAVLGALVLTGLARRPPRLATLLDLSTLVAAGVVCGAAALVEPFLGDGAVSTALLVEVGAQHATSVLLLCPLVLLADRFRSPSGSLGELTLQVGTLAAVTAAVFAPDQAMPLMYAPIPLLVWAALRFDAGIVAAELIGFALAVTMTTALEAGPVGQSTLSHDAQGIVVLGYVLTTVLISLPLALTVRQRLSLLARVTADENIFRRNFTESPLGMLLLHDVDGELVVDELNASACSILGASHAALAGRRMSDVLATYDRAGGGLAALQRGATDTWHGHAVALGRPGSRLEVAVAALDWRDGTRIYSAQLLDVTQEHDAHRRLVAAHRLNDATLDTTACIILVADATGTIVRVNAATAQITGYADTELVGQRIWTTPLATLSRAETEAMFVWPNRSGYPMVAERVGRNASGDPLRIMWNNNVVRDESGLPSYAVLTGIDVTAERSSTGLMTHLLSASIATALIGVDGRGRITLFNTGAAHMLGRSAEEMIGRDFVEIFDERQLRTRTGAAGAKDAFIGLVGMIGDRDESPARDWTWRTRRGHELIVSMTISVTEDLGEDKVGFLCVGRDVTEQREGQETLVAALEKERTAVDRLRELDRAKDEFVSTVSHELRTPVTSIIGYTEMLRDGSIVDALPDQLPMLATIARNGERLVAICNDLLLLSGFDADAAVGVRTRVDLRACVVAARDTVHAVVGDHAVEVDVSPGGVPLEVTGDRSQLDRLVANLLGNAVKFTPDGGRVEVALTHEGVHAVLTVRDTGIGIPAADHEAVFQRFFRSEQAQVRAIPGTGLGLPIVAAIVKAHAGTIDLESTVGLGTTFRVLIPLTDQPQHVPTLTRPL
jgi:PAS domain S-box-containing protein